MHEILHFIDKRGEAIILMNLDISKVYDMVSQDFMDDTLKAFQL